MEAAARGAAEGGGTVVGLVPSYDPARANRHLAIVIPTGMGHARNVLVAAAGDVLIALPGEHGTLAEIALARAIGRPVVALAAWRTVADVAYARTAGDAVRRALVLAARRVREKIGRIAGHMLEALTEGGADAALVASLFHFGELSIRDAKDRLAAGGLEVRR